MTEAKIGNRLLLCIPARGGSKRLPRKNLALLCGKPMLAYTIEAALGAGLSDDVYVCTEDAEIACMADQYGAKVFTIPEAMAGDEVSSTVPCLSLYDSLTRKGLEFDYIFNLQPTSPLRGREDICNSLKVLHSSNAHFLVSATPIDPHYFHWAIIEKQDTWEMYFGKEFSTERLFLPSVFRPNGAIKLARAAYLKKTGNYFGHPMAVYMMPEHRSIHVGTEFDLVCAEAMIRRNQPVGHR